MQITPTVHLTETPLPAKGFSRFQGSPSGCSFSGLNAVPAHRHTVFHSKPAVFTEDRIRSRGGSLSRTPRRMDRAKTDLTEAIPLLDGVIFDWGRPAHSSRFQNGPAVQKSLRESAQRRKAV